MIIGRSRIPEAVTSVLITLLMPVAAIVGYSTQKRNLISTQKKKFNIMTVLLFKMLLFLIAAEASKECIILP